MAEEDDVITSADDPRLPINQPMRGIPPAAEEQPEGDRVLTYQPAEAEQPEEAEPDERTLTYLPPENRDLYDIRARHALELETDPEKLARLYNLTHNEVGGQGPEARQAFIESIFNRANARNATLGETISDRHYYPSESYRPASVTQQDLNDYRSILSNVINGSNISRYATGNASGAVGFNGGPQVYAAGGERFGIEGPDQGWHDRLSAVEASRLTGKDPTQITHADINSRIQEVPQRALVAGEPTTASVEYAQSSEPQSSAITEPVEEPSTTEAGAGVGGGAGFGDVVTGDFSLPDPAHSKRTGTLPDGTRIYDNGAIKYHPSTDTLEWTVGGRTFIQSGKYGKVMSFKPDIRRDQETGEFYNFSTGEKVDVPGQSPAFDRRLSTDDNLKRLSPRDQAMVDLALNYQMPMTTRYGRMNPTFERLLPYIKAVDPSIDPRTYQIRQQTMLEMASDKNGSMGQRLNSWNQALIHAGALWDLAQKLPEKPFRSANELQNWVNTNLKGLPAEKTFNYLSHFVSNEMERGAIGGTPAVTSVGKLEEQLNAADSKAQIESILKNAMAQIIGGGLERVNGAYKRNMGTDYPTSKLIFPEAADSLNKFGIHSIAGRDISGMQQGGAAAQAAIDPIEQEARQTLNDAGRVVDQGSLQRTMAKIKARNAQMATPTPTPTP